MIINVIVLFTLIASLFYFVKNKNEKSKKEKEAYVLEELLAKKKDQIQDLNREIISLKRKIEQLDNQNDLAIKQWSKEIEKIKQLYNEERDKFSRIRERNVEEEKKIVLQKDKEIFYFLQLSEEALHELKQLEELKLCFSNKTIVNKLIWSEYYQKPLNELIKRVLKRSEISGIYKITCKDTGKIYIGRSVNVGDRWIQHIKSALDIGTIAKSNLYCEMKKYGIHNFSFELIEECSKAKLGEREKYYIDLYQTNHWGLNGNSGG